MTPDAKRIVLVLRSLERGGAERQVVHLARGLSQRGWHVTVVTFYAGGALAPELEAAAVAHVALEKRGRWDVLSFLVRLVRLLRRERPCFVYTFLDVPNVLVALVSPLLRRTRLVWGVRGSRRERAHYDRLHAVTLGLERVLSRRPHLVVVNSHAGVQHVRERRWRVAPEHLLVVPNGIVLDAEPDGLASRRELRSEWGFHDDDVVLAVVGRLDPVKGHRLFLAAAARAAAVAADARFLVVGGGPEAERAALVAFANAAGLSGSVVWAGQRKDMTRVYAAIDVLVSSSTSEGFSNVVAEAMAAGRVVIATDVGDSASIVADAGIVVPSGDEVALAQAMCEAVSSGAAARAGLGRKARDRVATEFGIEVMISRTEAALASVR